MIRRLTIILSILLLFSCMRKYECDVMVYNTDNEETHSISAGEDSISNYTISVTWPQGKKEVEELCKETWSDNTFTNDKGESNGIFDSCRCYNAD